MGVTKSQGSWTGDLKSGHGKMHPAHAEPVPFRASSRFEGEPASNPEELLGAALCGCFSMALSVALGKAGATPKQIDTHAATTLNKGDDGFAISEIALISKVRAEGIEPDAFQEIAQQTKQGCPVSKALAGTTVTLVAELVD